MPSSAYLANDRTLDDPHVATVKKGSRVRLRIINGATATAFTIDIGSLSGALIDGQLVQAVEGRPFPISMGQRSDLRLTLPAGGGAFLILALREGGDTLGGNVPLCGDGRQIFPRPPPRDGHLNEAPVRRLLIILQPTSTLCGGTSSETRQFLRGRYACPH